jgi:FkbM family methyltransferase
VPWIGGIRFIARSGETGVTGNIYTGLQDYEDMSFVLDVTSENDFFVDVGANVGTYSLLACGVKGAKGIALEPVPETFKRLTENVRLNELNDRVQLFNCGAGSVQQNVKFSTSFDTTNHVMTSDEKTTDVTVVSILKLDDIVGKNNPTLIKIDVEGFEFDVILGAQATLQSSNLKAILIELNGSGRRYNHSDEEVIDQLENFRLFPHRYIPEKKELREICRDEIKRKGNTIFSKRGVRYNGIVQIR